MSVSSSGLRLDLSRVLNVQDESPVRLRSVDLQNYIQHLLAKWDLSSAYEETFREYVQITDPSFVDWLRDKRSEGLISK
ncbi:MAG: hypothetical protein A3D96_06130 [Chlamydiae bacterium RIFCSPHIGHO2_12_FULL_44_59]|nr:MAG: hypothetical protein A2796_03955 [Chlamydiae bacterium RIFCSPHIGHO2_01_FULL_44_39]OGN58036.1 MAG: hypothetical protein A3C42_02685 [Chlamydiae bacterium RIFCSPHIGHO2_02_FULL_45_9]OGN61201.1 MAG: hypothetical protein A3D96_06130 [Chlamydiae bacterium RIFCSPHIGHO2_12_FULL_44_59]OGN65671.1 MAG: hypothetical protein A2978_06935 [Chlamydiae bacterium RIFCSPLOWO2_01_FULL_44_52]OGN68148.1 MAG: hypothetical protein A3I67_05605 [Chlamydiae bacterium RIFCSPLOWO2_02_FULL_45_22]OGN69036.1 MAG: hyp